MLQTHHCWLTGSHWSKKRGKVETNQLNWTYNSQDIIVFFIFCINCTVDLIVRVWICTTRKNPQISGPYSTKEEHCVTVCFYLQLKRSPYLRPITKRITTPFSSSLRNWSPTNVQYFRYEKMKGKKKGSTVQNGRGKASALWHPCLPYWISPLPVSKSGENAHDKRHPMPRSSLVALRVTRWHALAHRLGGSSRSQAHLDVRYRLIQRPAIETPGCYNKPVLNQR